MKIIAINGSPRKKANTATMCNKFLEGAKSVSSDVETEIINLFDLNYKGCISCFGCKRKLLEILRDYSCEKGEVIRWRD